jgi:uncharacterized membrane protein YgcG
MLAVAAACPVVQSMCLADSQQPQKQQQQPAGQLQALTESSWLTHWLLTIVHRWSHLNQAHRSLQHPAWRALLLPLAELGVAVLQTFPDPSSSSSSSTGTGSPSNSRSGGSSSSSSSGSSSTRRIEQHRSNLAGVVKEATLQLLQVLSSSIVPIDMPEATLNHNVQIFQQLLSANTAVASCLMRLLHLVVAWAAQAEHKRVKGISAVPMQAAALASSSSNRSSSSSSSSNPQRASKKSSSRSGSTSLQQQRRQQQQQRCVEVPAYHEQFLAAVGGCLNSKQARNTPPDLELAFVPGSGTCRQCITVCLAVAAAAAAAALQSLPRTIRAWSLRCSISSST